MAERKVVVHQFLYLAVMQAVPCAHEFHVEQNHIVVTWMACRGKAFA